MDNKKTLLDLLTEQIKSNSIAGKTIFFRAGRFIARISGEYLNQLILIIFLAGIICLKYKFIILFDILLFLFISVCYYSIYIEENHFKNRYNKILFVLFDVFLFTGICYYSGWKINIIILSCLNIILFFLYFYSAIAYLLIIPSDIRLNFKEEMININKLFLKEPGFYKFDRDFLYLVLIILLFVMKNELLIMLCVQLGIGIFVWLVQSIFIWKKIDNYV